MTPCASALADLEHVRHDLREFVGPGKNPELPDPFGGNLILYKQTLDAVKEAIPSLVEHIKNNC